MIVAFTGTQRGMTSKQYNSLVDRLWDGIRNTEGDGDGLEFRHGDCIGADAEFHHIVGRVFDFPPPQSYEITVYPCDIEAKRAHCEGRTVHPPMPPLERNYWMLIGHEGENRADLLIACPKRPAMGIRSGTWSTVRRALKLEIPVEIIWPNGTVERLAKGCNHVESFSEKGPQE